jgi:nucleotide-binding universal stress UspA family protein
MRVLCAIGIRGGGELVRRVVAYTGGAAVELLLMHVTDVGPRHDLDQLGGPFRRGPRGGPERERALDAAEAEAGRASLAEASAEAQRSGVTASTRLERGRPEQVLVAVARETGVALLALNAREQPAGHPAAGPGSVGHTARFVLDHAPCDVLLLRHATHG